MEKIKILVLGSTGMLGHVICSYLTKNKSFDIYDISFRKSLNPNTILCDVTKVEKLESIIFSTRPNFIVNCIGVLINEANKNPSNTIFLNAYFPHKLSEISKKINARLIHISSDCVFDGKKGFYNEDDIPSPKDLYGKTKALGEITYNDNLTLRTSIIGPELKKNGQGLFHWVMQQKKVIQGFSNVYWGGVTTLQLAKVIEKSIFLNLKGLILITNGSRISKFKLLQLINKYFKDEQLNILKHNVEGSDKSLVSKFNYFGDLILSYEGMIIEMKKYIQENKNHFNYKY